MKTVIEIRTLQDDEAVDRTNVNRNANAKAKSKAKAKAKTKSKSKAKAEVKTKEKTKGVMLNGCNGEPEGEPGQEETECEKKDEIPKLPAVRVNRYLKRSRSVEEVSTLLWIRTVQVGCLAICIGFFIGLLTRIIV